VRNLLIIKVFWNHLKLNPLVLGSTLLLANPSLAESPKTTAANLAGVQPATIYSEDTPPAPTTSTPTRSDSAAATKPKARPQNASYIGLGGDIGLSDGKTALGSGGLAILTHTRLTNNLSFHNATVIFGRRSATSNYALTFGIPIKNPSSGQVVAFPFIGGGVATRNSDGLKFAPLLSGGVDVPISRNFTGTARVNVRFGDDTDVGILIGVGYNFSLF